MAMDYKIVYSEYFIASSAEIFSLKYEKKKKVEHEKI